MVNLIRFHFNKLALVALSVAILIVVMLSHGEVKAQAEVNWLDVFGEGGAALFALVWLLLILGSRPNGVVTYLLCGGLGVLFFSLFADTLDEFIRMPDYIWWDAWLESATAPIGMVLLTWGLYQWHQEQLVLNRQMEKRERLLRDHNAMDYVTFLSSADYMKQIINTELEKAQDAKSVSVVMLDFDRFDAFNRRFGPAEGDHVLALAAELILMNLRINDLVCRYAGDRFIVMLPNTPYMEAAKMAWQLEESIGCWHYRTRSSGETVKHSVSSGVASATTGNAINLIKAANEALESKKNNRPLKGRFAV